MKHDTLYLYVSSDTTCVELQVAKLSKIRTSVRVDSPSLEEGILGAPFPAALVNYIYVLRGSMLRKLIRRQDVFMYSM